MAFAGEEQRPAEAAGEIRLEPGDPLGIEPFEVLGAAGESGELTGIARLGDHQAALAHRAGKTPRPPCDGGRATLGHNGLGGGPFAPRRQHATRHPRAAAVAQGAAALEDLDREAALAELERAGQARDAGTYDNDPGLTQDRKSTRLNSSHPSISYAVLCLKKKTA